MNDHTPEAPQPSETAARGLIDTLELRRALGTFVTGVTIVTTIDAAGEPRGITANSFTSVSLKSASGAGLHCKAFELMCSISGLRRICDQHSLQQQKHLSIRFAQRRTHKFLGIEWHRGLTGAPILPGASAWLECEPREFVDIGDHIILIGEVVAFEKSSLPPLAYFQGLYVCFSLLEDGISKRRDRFQAAALIDDGGRLVLMRIDGRWRLPSGDMADGRTYTRVIDELFSKLDAAVEISFLYSMFTAKCDGLTVPRPSGQSHKAVRRIREYEKLPPEEIPWDDLEPAEMRSVVQRYFKERQCGRFGIYVSDETGRKGRSIGGKPASLVRHRDRMTMGVAGTELFSRISTAVPKCAPGFRFRLV